MGNLCNTLLVGAQLVTEILFKLALLLARLERSIRGCGSKVVCALLSVFGGFSKVTSVPGSSPKNTGGLQGIGVQIQGIGFYLVK